MKTRAFYVAPPREFPLSVLWTFEWELQIFTHKFTPLSIEGGWGGWPPGNGKKLSSCQAQQHAWLLLNLFPFPVGHPPHPPCSLMQKLCQFLNHLIHFYAMKKYLLPRISVTGTLVCKSQQCHSIRKALWLLQFCHLTPVRVSPAIRGNL